MRVEARRGHGRRRQSWALLSQRQRAQGRGKRVITYRVSSGTRGRLRARPHARGRGWRLSCGIVSKVNLDSAGEISPGVERLQNEEEEAECAAQWMVARAGGIVRWTGRRGMIEEGQEAKEVEERERET